MLLGRGKSLVTFVNESKARSATQARCHGCGSGGAAPRCRRWTTAAQPEQSRQTAVENPQLARTGANTYGYAIGGAESTAIRRAASRFQVPRDGRVQLTLSRVSDRPFLDAAPGCGTAVVGVRAFLLAQDLGGRRACVFGILDRLPAGSGSMIMKTSFRWTNYRCQLGLVQVLADFSLFV